MRSRPKSRSRRESRPFRFFMVLCVLTAAAGMVSAARTALSSGEAKPPPEAQYAEVSLDVPRDPDLPETLRSGLLLREQGLATADGVGRIPEDTAQGRLLARRAALTDARRNLLLLRQKLVDGKFDPRYVSGRIAEVSIHSERVEGDLYFLKVDVPLDRLMKGDVPIE